MTVIAYKSGILAADSAVVANDTHIGTLDKLHKVGDTWVGFSGMLEDLEPFLATLSGEPPPQRPGSFNALLVRRGKVYHASSWGQAYAIRGPHHAVGSGSDLALGAMDAGATAEEAVRIACKRDVYSGGRVKVVRV